MAPTLQTYEKTQTFSIAFFHTSDYNDYTGIIFIMFFTNLQ